MSRPIVDRRRALSEMGRFVDAEIRKWAQVVKDSGARVD